MYPKQNKKIRHESNNLCMLIKLEGKTFRSVKKN